MHMITRPHYQQLRLLQALLQLQTLSKAQKRLPEQLLSTSSGILGVLALISAVYVGIKTLSHDDVSTFLVLFYGRNSI
jgi:hypothetical protein